MATLEDDYADASTQWSAEEEGAWDCGVGDGVIDAARRDLAGRSRPCEANKQRPASKGDAFGGSGG